MARSTMGAAAAAASAAMQACRAARRVALTAGASAAADTLDAAANAASSAAYLLGDNAPTQYGYKNETKDADGGRDGGAVGVAGRRAPSTRGSRRRRRHRGEGKGSDNTGAAATNIAWYPVLVPATVAGQVAQQVAPAVGEGEVAATEEEDTSLSESSGSGSSGAAATSKFSGGSCAGSENQSYMSGVSEHTGDDFVPSAFAGNDVSGGLDKSSAFAGKDVAAELGMTHPPDVPHNFAPPAATGNIGHNETNFRSMHPGGESGFPVVVGVHATEVFDMPQPAGKKFVAVPIPVQEESVRVPQTLPQERVQQCAGEQTVVSSVPMAQDIVTKFHKSVNLLSEHPGGQSFVGGQVDLDKLCRSLQREILRQRDMGTIKGYEEAYAFASQWATKTCDLSGTMDIDLMDRIFEWLNGHFIDD